MIAENQVIQLRESLNSKGYCQVNNILHPQLKEYLQISAQMLALDSLQEESNVNIIQTKTNYSQSQYSSIIGENLLIFFTKIYSQISGKNLIPTYSFFRKYYQTNLLERHTDRPSCQYSATIQLDSSKDESWPIFIQDKFNQEVKCETKVGDIIFYKGEEVEHWREELQYEYSSHLFLHGVDGDNPNYQPYGFDGRERLGISR